MRESLTDTAHRHLGSHLREGNIVIDATAGNGHDALFAASCCGTTGHVYLFDIQQAAITNSRNKLFKAGYLQRASFLCASHDLIKTLLPSQLKGNISASIYNLGYLPGGDKSITTETASTLASLEQSLEWLRDGGVISLMIYVGHLQGAIEHEAILDWLESKRDDLQSEWINPGCSENSPRLYICTKSGN